MRKGLLNAILLLVASGLMIVSFTGCTEEQTPTSSNGDKHGLDLVSISQTPGWAEDITVFSDTAFVADDEQGISIWDISDVTSPQFIKQIKTWNNVTQIEYASINRMLFTIEGIKSQYICGYTFSDTIQIIFQHYELGATGLSVYQEVIDTLIIAMSIPGQEFLIGKAVHEPEWGGWLDYNYARLYGAYRACFLDMVSDYAYLALGQFGFDIIQFDLDDFHEPQITHLSNVDTPGSAFDVTLNGSKTHAIVADYQSGIRIIDITDKTNPVIVGNLLPEGVDKAEKITAAGDTVYFIDRYNGVFAADISQPDDPIIIGYYQSPAPKGLFVREDHTIFLADETLGIVILSW